MTITDVLNYWNYVGVFSYVIPFLLIFAVVFAILDKSGILGNSNKAINTIVAASIGLLALQFELVPIFFSNIFPKMGVGLAAILVLLIFLGFVGINGTNGGKTYKAIGIIVGATILLWAFSDFWWFGSYGGNFGWWFNDYIWSLLILAAVAGVIYWVSQSGSSGGGGAKP